MIPNKYITIFTLLILSINCQNEGSKEETTTEIPTTSILLTKLQVSNNVTSAKPVEQITNSTSNNNNDTLVTISINQTNLVAVDNKNISNSSSSTTSTTTSTTTAGAETTTLPKIEVVDNEDNINNKDSNEEVDNENDGKPIVDGNAINEPKKGIFFLFFFVEKENFLRPIIHIIRWRKS
jgi:hypothetical protein